MHTDMHEVCVCFKSDLQGLLQVSVSKYCPASLHFADLTSRSISETSETDYRQDSLEILPKRTALQNERASISALLLTQISTQINGFTSFFQCKHIAGLQSTKSMKHI